MRNRRLRVYDWYQVQSGGQSEEEGEKSGTYERLRESLDTYPGVTGPKQWQLIFRDEYASIIPPSERSDIISAYYKRLCSSDDKISLEAAQAWSRWEQRTSRLRPDPALIARADDDLRWARAFARIECHYFVNGVSGALALNKGY